MTRPTRSFPAPWAALAAGACLASPMAVRASSAELFGAGPRNFAQVGAATATADDGSAAFYNPAGLGIAAESGKASVSVGVVVGVPVLNVRRELNDAGHLEAQPTQQAPNQGYGSLQALFPLGGKLQNKAALGMLLIHPQSTLVRVQLLDPKLPQWTRYASSPERFEMALGLGARLTDKIAVGAGAIVLAGLSGDVDFRVDLFARRVDRRNLDFRLNTVVAPVAGFTITPVSQLRLSFNYRGAIGLDIRQPNTIALGDLGTLQLDVAGTVHYSPHQLAVGASFQPSDALRISLDAKLDLWSLSPYPAAAVNVSLVGQVPEALGLDKVLSFGTKDPATGFANTLTSAAAIEYTFRDRVTRLRGGYAFRPTYVPDQVKSISNFLDSSAHVIGLGATFQFHDPVELFTAPIKVDLGAQAQVLQARQVKKEQGANDPVGSYDFGGTVFAGAASLRYEF